MESSKPAFQKYFFVCENEREAGACCMPQGLEIRQALKDLVKSEGLGQKIRVSRAGCLDVCSEGPNVLLMPDNIWFKKVTVGDIHGLVSAARKALT
jgi:(2Fe-2S) ferredoxin